MSSVDVLNSAGNSSELVVFHQASCFWRGRAKNSLLDGNDVV
jgi:hypothetical protein